MIYFEKINSNVVSTRVFYFYFYTGQHLEHHTQKVVIDNQKNRLMVPNSIDGRKYKKFPTHKIGLSEIGVGKRCMYQKIGNRIVTGVYSYYETNDRIATLVYTYQKIENRIVTGIYAY